MNLRWNENKSLYYFLFFIGFSFITLLWGHYPQVFAFATDSSLSYIDRFIQAPIHLEDDVMIALRPGYIFNETGYPSYNRLDLSQPSTSYISPYLFAALLKVFPENFAVLVYAALGFFVAIFTLLVIVKISQSKFNAILICTALCISCTNLQYALNGWDHLFQTFFIVLATSLALNVKFEISVIKHILIGLLLATGVLFRPDGIIIACALLISVFLSDNKINRARVMLITLPIFALIISVALYINFEQFGYLTPTTARLKIGASPSIIYSLTYLFKNSFMMFSAITILMACFIVAVSYRRELLTKFTMPLLIGCFLSFLASSYNSDVFIAGRMFWLPACIMSIVVLHRSPTLIKFNFTAFDQFISVNNFYSSDIFNKLKFHKTTITTLIVIIFLANGFSAISEKLMSSLVKNSNLYSSSVAQQFMITKWIEQNLTPSDGAIGYFYLGVSYHLEAFEIADFLGKADELIAATNPRFGPPGHNKWDIDKTINKWKLQAIIPHTRADTAVSKNRRDAEKRLSLDQGAPNDELMFHKTINAKFRYCYIDNSKTTTPPDNWGFFLRNDLAQKHSNSLLCK